MKKQDILKILNGNWGLIPSSYRSNGPEVTIYPHQVKASLERYLSGEWSAEQLTDWANYICYGLDGTSPLVHDEAFDDYYDDMWDVLRLVASPYLDRKITTPLINEYRDQLKKYDNDSLPKDLLTLK